MAFIVLVGLIFGSGQQPISHGVLAYATEMSSSQLLNATNQQRSSNGQATLRINDQLSAAAQAKAEDMASRNYWSHNTPDGTPPWVFIDAEGYGYTKAGENLAYGFATSASTVTGWMNSPSHKANLLDGAYSEVGFGYVNANSYNNSGQQTIVVAMYGQPHGSDAVAANSPAENPSSSTPEAAAIGDTVLPAGTTAPNSKTLIHTEPASTQISAFDIIAAQAPWMAAGAALTMIAALLFVTLKHSLAFRRVLIHGEQFFLKHPLLDIALVAFVMAGYVFNQTGGGFIR